MELFTLLGMIADKLRFDCYWSDERISLTDDNGIDDGKSIFIELDKEETERYIEPLLDTSYYYPIEIDLDNIEYSKIVLEHGDKGYEIARVIFYKEEYKEIIENGCKITNHITTEEPHELKENIYSIYTGETTLETYHTLCNALAGIMCEGDEKNYTC